MAHVDLLARTLGFSGLAGLNPYGTAVTFGLLLRAGLIADPTLTGPAFRMFADTGFLTLATVLFLLNLMADKLPLVDHLWDVVHTAVRPLAGAYVGLTLAGAVSPEGSAALLQLAYAITGLTVAASTHVAKAATRKASTLMTAGLLNPFVSFLEHVIVVVGTTLVALSPIMGLLVFLAAVAILYVGLKLAVRASRRVIGVVRGVAPRRTGGDACENLEVSAQVRGVRGLPGGRRLVSGDALDGPGVSTLSRKSGIKGQTGSDRG